MLDEQREKIDRVKTFKMPESLARKIEQHRQRSGRTVDATIRYLIERGLEAEEGRDVHARLERLEAEILHNRGRPSRASG